MILVRLQIGHDEAIRHAPHPAKELSHHLFLAGEYLLFLLFLMQSLSGLLDGHTDHEKSQQGKDSRQCNDRCIPHAHKPFIHHAVTDDPHQ